MELEIYNKKTKYDYFIEDEYEAGIVLTGTEIKSVRNGSCNIKDCYGIVKNNEIYLLNMFIGQYKEIKKISEKIELQGLTLVPIKLYFKNNKLKVLLGVCRGKKTFDKRESIKERDIKREVAKNLKKF